MRPGLFLLVALFLPLGLVARTARAEDDLVLDLGGAVLETRHIGRGSFTLGASTADAAHDKDEEPAHQVTITQDFWMGKFPVTRGQFAKFVADTRYITDAEKGLSGGAGWDGKTLVHRKDFTWRSPGFTQTEEHPVVLVTYGDATAFTSWASHKTGKRVRLPTEAEWELAARGGTTTPWYAGTDGESSALGWFKAGAGNGTRPVGKKKANPFGLFDMSGNVYEWCRDVYAPYHEGAAVDPLVTTTAGAEPERRVLRGGSWLKDAKRARSSARHRNAPGSRNADNGFRVVVTNEEVVGGGTIGATPDFAAPNPERYPGATADGLATPGSAGSSSGPRADGEPVRLDPTAPASEPLSWGVLLLSPLAAASAVVAWILLRRKGSAVGAATRPDVSTRVSDDGFFVRAPRVPAGSRARYECIVNGIEMTDFVPLAGDETFVYTGSAPTEIRIVEVLTPPPGGHRAPARPAPHVAVDPELIPPSSRPRPPPVPSRRPAPPLPARAPTTGQPPAKTEDRESAGPMLVSLIDDLTSSAHLRSSPDLSSTRFLSASAIASTMSMGVGDKAPSDTSSPPKPASDTAAPGEPFLGNPRAY